MAKPLFISIPHAGETVPEEASWLRELPEPILFCDSDRYVDMLYTPAIEKLKLPAVVAKIHRYVVDLNRWPDDIDKDSVIGSDNPAGTHPKGYHWSITTKGNRLISQPLTMDLHRKLTSKYFEPFHAEIKKMGESFKKQGAQDVFHIDAHSMPSVGEALHVDPGEKRAEIVISDFKGKSSRKDFLDLVVAAYEKAGFTIKVNWPYIGGRITQTYGQPQFGFHTIQVEMNRALYMDEESKSLSKNKSPKVQQQVLTALSYIKENLPDIG